MKKAFVFALILCATAMAFAQNPNSAPKIGLQACSDSYFGFVFKTGHFESGLMAQLDLYDPGDELLVAGVYLAWLFNSADGLSSFGAGVDFRNGFGSGISEHVDLALRLSCNYHLSEHFMLTGIFYPLSLSTRETEGLDDWNSTATIPSAAVAVTVFF